MKKHKERPEKREAMKGKSRRGGGWRFSHKCSYVAPRPLLLSWIFARFLLNAEDSYHWEKTRQHSQELWQIQVAKKQSSCFEKLPRIWADLQNCILIASQSVGGREFTLTEKIHNPHTWELSIPTVSWITYLLANDISRSFLTDLII